MGSKTLTMLLWVFCFAAITASSVLVYHWTQTQGPEIQITFKDVSGVVPNQTKVIYRGANIGKITQVHLDEDQKHVILTARLLKEAQGLIGDGAQFWIVSPEVNFKGISNLGTISSGVYLTLNPSTGPTAYKFTGLEDEPPPASLANGLTVLLESDNIVGLDQGAALFYRGIQVGEVMDVALPKDAAKGIIKAKIYEDYKYIVREQSTFWITSAVDADISIFGGESSVSLEPLRALFTGSITFISNMNSPQSKGGETFKLLAKKPESADKPENSGQKIEKIQNFHSDTTSPPKRENASSEQRTPLPEREDLNR